MALALLHQKVYELNRELKDTRTRLQLARSELIQLRVAQESVRDRTGFMVSAFIPDGALRKLRARPELVPGFKYHVADALVSNAIDGLLRVKEGRVAAMVFFQRDQSSPVSICPVFDTTPAVKYPALTNGADS